MKASSNGIRALAEHESVRYKAYDDAQPNVNITSASQIKGVLTIGFGHTGNDVYVGQTCTHEKALQWLSEDIETAEKAVERLVKVDINQNQLDALISFTYNAGQGNLAKSDLLKKLNANDHLGAADEFNKWVYGRVNGVKVKLNGLVIRRAKERELFLTGLGVLKPVNPSASNVAVQGIALVLAALSFT